MSPRWGRAAALGAVAAATVLAVGAAEPHEAADGYATYVAALALLWLVRRIRRATGADRPSAYDRAVAGRRAPGRSRPATLERVEREVVLSGGSAFDLHVRLRPRLRAIAEHRLAARRALDLDSGSPEVRELLGPELWELLRPDRPVPRDRVAPGLPPRRQRELLDRLESI